MLTRVLMRDAELAALDEDDRLALEYVVRTTMSEVARDRRHGDSALLLAVSAAEVLEPLLDRLGEHEVDDLLARTLGSDLGQVALRRAHDLAALTAA
jgi:hypothetical protein